ncbi:hypothetical protein L2E82_30684 [Cichorium intybus]|uniref:Uncharacterized protein n=1 Tax=Cichorium intybus TaxID=13427 RepID=A0ACB9D0W4_CICIN|nr:hypothetical protein L2E82_30684 [Cichorium intybus]
MFSDSSCMISSLFVFVIYHVLHTNSQEPRQDVIKSVSTIPMPSKRLDPLRIMEVNPNYRYFCLSFEDVDGFTLDPDAEGMLLKVAAKFRLFSPHLFLISVILEAAFEV